MKKLAGLMILLLALAMPAFAATEKTLPDGAHLVAFSVPDVECAMCAKSLNTELRRVDGVQEIKFDELKRVVTIKFDASQTTADKLKQAIKRAGFNSKAVEPQG
jgi:copper chaperone CopZ